MNELSEPRDTTPSQQRKTLLPADGMKTLLLVLMGLCAVNFAANFLFFSHFGFYEDDYLFTIPSFGWNFSDLAAHVHSAIVSWPQGRPVWWVLQYCLTFSLSRCHAIWPFHLFSFMFLSGVAFTVFLFLRQFSSTLPAFLATTFYLLFPADTAKQIFMHQLGFGFCMLLTLTAFFGYIKGRPLVTYIMAALILLNYEPYFLLLFFAPMLKSRPDNGWKKLAIELFRNAVLLTLVIALIFIARKCMGESRVAMVFGSLLPTYLMRAMKAPWIGSYTALSLCITRPVEALLHTSALQKILSLAAGGIIGAVCIALSRSKAQGNGIETETPSSPDRSAQHRFLVIAAGIGMFFFAYVYRFIDDYYPPKINIGRLSALHSVGLIGLCLVAVVLLDRVIKTRPGLGKLIIGVVVCYQTLLVGFGIEIQETQFVRNWNQQKLFYESLLSQIGDLHDGDAIFVDIETGMAPGKDYRPCTEGFPPFWMVNYPVKIFSQLFQAPADWKTQPMLYGLYGSAKMERVTSGLLIKTPPYYETKEQPVITEGKFLRFEWVNGALVRSNKPVEFQGELFNPRPVSSSTSHRFPTAKLYKIFFKLEERPLWHTLTRSINYPS